MLENTLIGLHDSLVSVAAKLLEYFLLSSNSIALARFDIRDDLGLLNIGTPLRLLAFIFG